MKTLKKIWIIMIISATISIFVINFYSIFVFLILGNRDAHQWEQIWLLITVLTFFIAVILGLITNFKQIIRAIL